VPLHQPPRSGNQLGVISASVSTVVDAAVTCRA
jgi:hypothetical protein